MSYVRSSVSFLLLLWSYRIDNIWFRPTANEEDYDDDDDVYIVKKQQQQQNNGNNDVCSLFSFQNRRSMISFLIVIISLSSWFGTDQPSTTSSMTGSSSLYHSIEKTNQSITSSIFHNDNDEANSNNVPTSSVIASERIRQWNYHHSTSTMNETIKPQNKNIHVIVLVHGWMGNPVALDYLEQTIQSQSNNNNDMWIVHKAACNHGKTFDGVAKGGKRLANEINDLLHNVLSKELQQQQQLNNMNTTTTTVSLSIIGQSLGGLYGRYALSQIDWNIHEKFNNHDNNHHHHEIVLPIIPAVFCTVTTPHLGVSQNTYIQLPRYLESIMSTVLQQTGIDLFRYSNVLDQLTINDIYTKPLIQFYHRRLYSNVHHTDFLVPFRTSAALTKTTNTIHYPIKSSTINEYDHVDVINARDQFVILTLETKQKQVSDLSSTSNKDVTLSYDEMAQSIDEFGWTKVFCDMRNALYSVPIWSKSSSKDSDTEKENKKSHYTSYELLTKFENNNNNRYYAPFGHGVMIANSMTKLYGRIMSSGKPMVDRIGYDIIEKIVEAKQYHASKNQKISTRR